MDNLKTEGKSYNGQHRNNGKILKQQGTSIMNNTEAIVKS
jgi:hypothetical protein